MISIGDKDKIREKELVWKWKNNKVGKNLLE